MRSRIRTRPRATLWYHNVYAVAVCVRALLKFNCQFLPTVKLKRNKIIAIAAKRLFCRHFSLSFHVLASLSYNYCLHADLILFQMDVCWYFLF